MSKFSKSQGRRDSLNGQQPDPFLSRVDKDYRDGYKSAPNWIYNITSQPLSPPPSNKANEYQSPTSSPYYEVQGTSYSSDGILDNTVMRIVVYIIYGIPPLFLAVYAYLYDGPGNGILGAICGFGIGIVIWQYPAGLLVFLLYMILKLFGNSRG